MRETGAHICELRDDEACHRFWMALRGMAAQEVPGKAWADIGVQHWHFLIGSRELLVCEDYGELNNYGAPELVKRMVAASVFCLS